MYKKLLIVIMISSVTFNFVQGSCFKIPKPDKYSSGAKNFRGSLPCVLEVPYVPAPASKETFSDPQEELAYRLRRNEFGLAAGIVKSLGEEGKVTDGVFGEIGGVVGRFDSTRRMYMNLSDADKEAFKIQHGQMRELVAATNYGLKMSSPAVQQLLKHLADPAISEQDRARLQQRLNRVMGNSR